MTTTLRAQLLELDVPLPPPLGKRHVGVLLRVPVDQAAVLGPALWAAVEIEVRVPGAEPAAGQAAPAVKQTMTRTDLQRELGLSRSTVDRMRRERADFPTEFRASGPTGGPRWNRDEVMAFKLRLQEETRQQRAAKEDAEVSARMRLVQSCRRPRQAEKQPA